MSAPNQAATVARDQATLETLLLEYRKTFRQWGAALAGSYDREMSEEESRAYQEAAGAPCHAAIDAMIEAPVVSLEDIKTKLRFLFEVTADGDAGVDPGSWGGRIVSNILRDMDAATIPAATPIVFSPSAFAEQVIEAVLPLIDDKGTNLQEGKTPADVVRALQPAFGRFTVYDAVMVYFMLDPAGNTDCETPDGKDNPRSHAVYLARTALVDFACYARSSSARCAEARAYLAQHDTGMDELSDGEIFRTIAEDVKYVSRGRYRGQRFGDIDRRDDSWLPCSMKGELAPPAMTLEEQTQPEVDNEGGAS